MDFLKSAVASAISKGPPFPYTFGDRVTVNQSIWTLYHGVKRVRVFQLIAFFLKLIWAVSKEDNSDCSIFAFDVHADRSRLPLARNAVRKMRILRHPGVIKVLDTVEVLLWNHWQCLLIVWSTIYLDGFIYLYCYRACSSIGMACAKEKLECGDFEMGLVYGCRLSWPPETFRSSIYSNWLGRTHCHL